MPPPRTLMYEELVEAFITDTLDPDQYPPEKLTLDLKETISHNPSCTMVVGPRGMTLAHVAAQHGLIEVTEHLIKHKIPVLSDDYGAQPWHTAAEYGNIAAIEAYYNAWHDIMGHFGTIDWTILHLAALFNQCEVLEWVLGTGADVDVLDKSNRTPLFVAIQYKRKEAATLLCR